MKGRITIAALGLLMAASCVVRRAPAAGNITFLWTFAGKTCAQVPQVAGVHITIPGEALQNDGVYNCTTGGVDGIVLNSFVGGGYTFTIDGNDSQGNTLYSATGSFTVDGDITVTVDVPPVAGPTTYAFISWTLPNAPGGVVPPACAPGGLTVNVSIDGAAAQGVACATGLSGSGYQTPLLAAGTHAITFSAVDPNGFEYYHASSTFTTTVGNPTSQSFSLLWSVGGVYVGWNLLNRSSMAATCASGGLTTLNLQIYNSANQPYFTAPGAQVTCTASAALAFPVAPGTYTAILSGTASDNSNWTSSIAAPPSLTVSAGGFPGGGCTYGTDPGCLGTLTVTQQ